MMGGGHGGGGGGGGGFGGHHDGWDDENLGAVYNQRIAIRLIPYIKMFKLWAAIALVGMLAATFSSVAIPWFIGVTVDTAIATGDSTRLMWLAGLFFGLIVINAFGLWLQSRYMAKVAHGMLVHIRTQLFEHLHKQSLGFYDKQQVGRLMSRVVSDVEQIQQVMTGGIIGTISDVLTLVGIVVWMFLDRMVAGIGDAERRAFADYNLGLLAKAGARGFSTGAARHLRRQRQPARKRVRRARRPKHEPRRREHATLRPN